MFSKFSCDDDDSSVAGEGSSQICRQVSNYAETKSPSAPAPKLEQGAGALSVNLL